MQEFDDIRPYYDEEVSGVLGHLIRDSGLLNFIACWRFPRLHRLFPFLACLLVRGYLSNRFGGVSSIKEFQDMVYHFARKIVTETTDGFEYSGLEHLAHDKGYIFVSNHRDIAGDSMLLDYALHVSGFETVRIAVGDNLVQVGFATDLMKLNKSFFIKRSAEGVKKIYAALLQSSRYMHNSLEEGQSIWIAQSEGRAKDGMDLTDPAIIKMFMLADRKANFPDVIRMLNIVPMAVSYEYDPCDVPKAIELAAIEADGVYQKPKGEDLANLARGLGGYKGRVVLRLGKPLSANFPTADAVASEIDGQIRDNLELFPINHWALSKLEGTDEPGKSVVFEQRLLACPEHARAHLLAMYANPVRNKRG